MTNPFAQPQLLTELTVTLPERQAILLEMGFEDIALAQTRFIEDEDKGIWRMRILYDAAEGEDIPARMQRLRAAFGEDFPEPVSAAVGTRDWVAEVQASFRPIRAGRYFVHGSHIDDTPQVGLIPILMDAGAAFGTGEHETTSGCLLALDALAKSHRFSRVLDMGCGSGILAIAAAKSWSCRADAVDIDEVSVRVARENMALNGVTVPVRCWRSDGFRGVRGQYDLIIANILARPLMDMAGDLKRHLKPGGYVVLSGLLVRQEPMVLWAHRAHGLRLLRRYRRNGWSALVLR